MREGFVLKAPVRGKSGLRRLPGQYRTSAKLLADAVVWLAALPLAAAVRYLDINETPPITDSVVLGALAVEVQLCASVGLALERGRHRYGSFDDAIDALLGTTLATAGMVALNLTVFDRSVPATVPAIAGMLALTLQMIPRIAWRVAQHQRSRPDARVAQPVVIFGAGEGGDQLVRTMLRDPHSPYLPVALLDDDPVKADLRIHGVPVLGNRTSVRHILERTGASTLIVAIPSAGPELLRFLAAEASAVGVAIRVLPPVTELLGRAPGLSDVRPITEIDLLGRHQIDTDVASIAGYLANRRVLVTGAGGSIGSELCRQVQAFGPREMVMLDRDESALHAVQLSLHGRALLDDPNLVVADIRDAERLREVWAQHRPEVVFHAAALKHLTLLEQHPGEAVKTNVIGTQNVLDASRATGVDKFVNISTDKAANPTSMLGYTKRVAERLTAAAAQEAEGTYLSVRFGNVLGSRGSVLTAFRAQIAAGGPVTVTHAEVTRFFMTVEEAVQLVIQAGAIGRDGEVLVLDMGEPVAIADVAKRLIEATGEAVRIEYTGLRPGEKLHEELLGTGEVDDRPSHPLISQVPVPPLDPATVCDPDLHSTAVVERLAGLSGFDRPLSAT